MANKTLKELQFAADRRGLGPIVKILHTATVLHEGWEADNEVWLVQGRGGETKALGTNHGSLCELRAETLDGHIAKTEKSLNELKALKNFRDQNCKYIAEEKEWGLERSGSPRLAAR